MVRLHGLREAEHGRVHSIMISTRTYKPDEVFASMRSSLGWCSTCFDEYLVQYPSGWLV